MQTHALTPPSQFSADAYILQLHCAFNSKGMILFKDFFPIFEGLSNALDFQDKLIYYFNSHSVLCQWRLFQRLFTSAPYLAWIKKLFDTADYQKISLWTDIMREYFSCDQEAVLGMQHCRAYFAERPDFLTNALMRQDPLGISLALYWGGQPNTSFEMGTDGEMTASEFAIILGSREILGAGYEDNIALKALLQWDIEQKRYGNMGLHPITKNGPLTHYAVAAGNLEALPLLEKAGHNLLAINRASQTILDLMIDSEHAWLNHREVVNWLETMKGDARCLCLWHLFMHADERGIFTWQRLHKQFYNSFLEKEPANPQEADVRSYYASLNVYWSSMQRWRYDKMPFPDVEIYGMMAPCPSNAQHLAHTNIDNAAPELPININNVGQTLLDISLEKADAPSYAANIEEWLESLLNQQPGVLYKIFMHVDKYQIATWQRLNQQLAWKYAVPQNSEFDDQVWDQYFLMIQRYWIVAQRYHYKKTPWNIIVPKVIDIQLPGSSYTPSCMPSKPPVSQSSSWYKEVREQKDTHKEGCSSEDLTAKNAPLLMSVHQGAKHLRSPRPSERKSISN